MPIPRKTAKAASEPLTAPARDPRPPSLPRRMVVFAIIRDESGSMAKFRQRQGEFLPLVCQSLTEKGGPKIAELVYVLYVVVSGDVVATEFMPLKNAVDPEFQPDGQTPLGQAFTTASEKIEAFLEDVVFPAETTVKALEVLVASDLQPTGESSEETAAGVERFLAVAKKYRANVTLVGPSPEVMNRDLAAKLDVAERGVKYLDSDPKAVINVTFESLLQASRVLTGSKPRNR